MATELAFPHGMFDVFADDDDVIGLTVARTNPSGFSICRINPPIMDAFDEIGVAMFLSWCLNHSERLLAMQRGEPDA